MIKKNCTPSLMLPVAVHNSLPSSHPLLKKVTITFPPFIADFFPINNKQKCEIMSQAVSYFLAGIQLTHAMDFGKVL